MSSNNLKESVFGTGMNFRSNDTDLGTESENPSSSNCLCRPLGLGYSVTESNLSAGGFKSPGGRVDDGGPEKLADRRDAIPRVVFKSEKMHDISSIEELFTVCNYENSYEYKPDVGEDFIDFTVDSGAADTVADETIAPNCPTVPSEGSKKGVKYVAAAGKVIANEGEKNVKTQTGEGHLCGIKIQIAKVNKALLSVSKICDAGHEVVFNDNGGRTVHCTTGQVVKFRRVDGVYRLRVKIVGEQGSGFIRPGM
jgi:hypothetical protein